MFGGGGGGGIYFGDLLGSLGWSKITKSRILHFVRHIWAGSEEMGVRFFPSVFIFKSISPRPPLPLLILCSNIYDEKLFSVIC